MEINASYRTCIVGKVIIHDGLRVMLTEIEWSLNEVKMLKTQVDPYISCRQVVSLQGFNILTSCSQSTIV